MRFLKGMLGVLFFGGGVIGLVWLATPEVMVWWAAMQLRNEVAGLKRLENNVGYRKECYSETMDSEGSVVAGYQLRFEDESSYVTEVVCSDLIKGVVEVSRGELPFGVARDKGYSGVKFSWEDGVIADSRVVVGLWGRRWWVGFEEGKVRAKRVFNEMKVDKGVVVANTCGGWGFECCSEVSHEGRGERLVKNVLDCPVSCYERCLARPTVTTFLSEPFVDEERVVYVAAEGEGVTFSWRAQDLDGTVVRVEIDFGDGETEVFGEAGMVSHNYQCWQESCVFEASLVVVDDDGLQSKEGRGSRLTVVVGG